MQVGRAATEIRLEPEDVRLRAIARPAALMDVARHLIRLLIILMCPHIVSEGSGKSVEGKPL